MANPPYNIDTDGLTAFFPLFEGHTRDIIGGNVGVITNGNINDWAWRNNKLSYKPRNNTGRIVVPHHSSLDIGDTYTLVILYPNFLRETRIVPALYPRIWSKKSAVGVNFDLAWVLGAPATSYIVIQNGVSTQTFNLITIASKFNTLIFTKSSGNVASKAYTDGVFLQNGSIPQQYTPLAVELDLCNEYTGNFPNKEYACAFALYNVEKTAPQVADIHQSLVSLVTPTTGCKGRYISIPGKQESYQDLAVFGGMRNDQVVDSSPNGLVGTRTNQVVNNALLPCGLDGIRFNRGAISFGNSNVLNYTTETFGGYGIIEPKEIGTLTSMLLCRGLANTDGYYIQLGSGVTRRIFFVLNQAGANQLQQNATLLENNRLYWFGFLSVAGGQNYLYLENVNDSFAVTNRTNPASSARNFYLSRYDSGAYPGSFVLSNFEVSGKFTSKEDFEAKMKAAWIRIAKSVMLKGDYYLYPESPATYSAGQWIGKADAGWKVISGTHKVNHEQVNGRWCKVLECVTNGRLSISHLITNSAYGTWEIYWKKSVGPLLAPSFEFIANNQTTYTATCYALFFNGSPNYRIILAELGGNLCYTDTNYITPDTWYKLRVTRSTPNSFSVYCNDILVPVVFGTNPVTDTSTVVSSCLNLVLAAGDKVVLADKEDKLSFIKTFGALSPSDWSR